MSYHALYFAGSTIIKLTSLARNRFVRNVATLISGKAVAAIVALALAPIVARLFIPEHFGVVALFLAIIAIVEPVSAVCFDQAALLPRRDEEAWELVSISLIAVAIVVSLMLFAIGTLQLVGTRTELQDQLGNTIWLLPFVVALIGVTRIAENWRLRKKLFASIARADVAQSLTTPSCRIGLGALFGSSIGALLTGYLIGLAARFQLLWRGMALREYAWNHAQGFAALRQRAGEYREFPLFTAPARFVRAFSASLPVLVLGLLFSPAAAGLFAMANRLIGAPSEIVAGAVRRVYLQEAAERFSAGRTLRPFLVKIMLTMFLIGLVPFALLGFYGSQLVTVFLGANWAGAGRYAELLAAWFFMVWLTSPSAMLYIVMRRQKQWFVSQMILAGLRTVALFGAAALGKSAVESIATYVAASVALNIGVIAYIGTQVSQYEAERAASRPAAE